MNNYQWLLQMDGAERKAWFDAEHVETEERALDGDTEPESEDSRERLEADALKLLKDGYVTYPQIIALLDRQAAITERETKLRELYKFEENHREHIRSLEETNRKLNERIAELTAELDAAKQQISQFDAPKSGETSENPASKCEIRDFDDSREKLEADVRKHYSHTTSTLMYPPSANKQTDWLASMPMDTVFGWLNRQAAITERECIGDAGKASMMGVVANERECYGKRIDELTAERDELKGQVFTLKGECEDLENEHDKLQEQLRIGWECECRLQAERERYRSKFGKCLDYADAIHALMDDEGMA